MCPMASATIYARQSFDRHGDSLAVDRQLDLCRRFAAAQGWEVRAEYVDNDRSATSGVERPAFEQLLASDPERIVVWHVDRLVRLTVDLERVIALGVNVHAVEAGHLDLSNPAGRAVARTVTAWATYEGEQKALRQRAANDQRAQAGLPYGRGRAFGYEEDGVTVREAEAAELRRAAEAVLRGETMSSVVRDLNARGVTTASGKPWRTTTLRVVLTSPRNAGLRRHRGEVIGKAAWPAIFDEDTAAALRALFNDPARRHPGPPRRYLLSGALTCGICGKPMSGANLKDGGKGPTYRCLPHLQRKAAPLDEYVTALVVARLSKPDAHDLFARPGDEARLEALREEAAGLRPRLDGLAEAFADGAIDAQALAAGSRRLRARLEAIEEETRTLASDPVLADLAGAEDVAEAFAAMPVEARRRVVRSLVRLTLVKTRRGRGVPVSEAVRVEWVSR